MSSIDELMSRLRELHVTLWVDGDQLGCRAPKGALTRELTRELSARKAAILEYLQQAESLTTSKDSAIPRIARDQALPLSFGQQRLWFLDRLEGASATYNMPLAVQLDGNLNIAALEKVLDEIVRRHEVLRANFIIQDEQPVMQIRDLAECPIDLIGAEAPEDTTANGASHEAQIQNWVAEAAQQHFDLATDRLLRARLIRLSETSYLFLLSMHHIVSDGWSLGVLVRELITLYEAFCQGLPSPLPELPIQYIDYAHWQRQRLQGAFLETQLDYWRTQLAGIPEVIDLPTDRPRPPIQTYHGRSLSCRLDAQLSAGLQALSQTAGTTLFMTLLSGFAILLSRYSGEDDIVVGTAVANRNHPDIEALIGLFINTLALRLDLSADPPAREILERVRHTCLQAYEHQEVPFEQLVEVLQPPRKLSHSPLFQVTFDVQNTPLHTIELPSLRLIPVEQEALAAKFDLSLSLEEAESEWLAVWSYNPDLFDAATISRMMGHYRVLLQGMLDQPHEPVSRLPLLAASERQQLLYAWNDATRHDSYEQTFLALFEAWVATSPDRIAVSTRDASLTYRQAHERACQLAAYLQAAQVGPETLVAVYVERSFEMIIGLLGVMKAGGAYIPLDPAYPKERLAWVLDDAQPRIVLSQAHLETRLPETAAQVVCLDRDWQAIAAAPWQTADLAARAAAPDNAAYVIYTSGSTGRPKGVQVSHRALLNFLLSMQREPGLNSQDALLAVTTISFDIAALEMYLPLITGARLMLADREMTLDGHQLHAALHTHGVTCMQATPATWRLLVETDWQPPPSLRVLCGGEALSADLADQLLQHDIQLWNLYGPTETTIWSAVRQVTRPLGLAPEAGGEDRQSSKSVEPIGPPIDHTYLYILDRHYQPAPIGIPGELYIGGDGLARGYLNRPDLTAGGFLPDPFCDVAGARLYRTGDLARRLPDGRIDFLGRVDFQVKLRGYRIELGEIEAALRQQPDINQAVVAAREDAGDKRLVAYLTASAQRAPETHGLRARLQDTLPEYMIPSAFVWLDALPLTPNGKIDRQALPAPDQARPDSSAAFLAPSTAMEHTIADIWRQALQVDKVGIDDNFFDLGGHSLLMTQVHEAIRQRLGLSLQRFQLVELFQHPTIRTLAASLARHEQNASETTSIRLRSPARPARERGQIDHEIAIIGLAGRFPDADDLHAFWAHLRDGRESIRFFSDEELLAAGIEAELLAQPNYVRANGVLSDVTCFDASFFGVTPADAEVMDPQHRLFMETAWHTLEHAGYGAQADETAIGVFAGCSHNGYLIHHLLPHLYTHQNRSIYQVMIGNDKDFLPTRVSYALDLKGPSISVQTACSTSLVAVHLACRSLLDGECDMALAGGVGIKIPQTSGYLYEPGMIHSPDGHCRAFDAKAQGTTWGSGVGIVLLKPLAAAQADRDSIYAVIKGSAVNNDGALKVGFTAPGVAGQAEVIANAQARAGVDPESISYIETHGTGTPMGDPIEIAALQQVFQASTDKQQFCALGAVKTNIGHLDIAAGIAGLFKTVLALQHRQIPPTLHFEHANPDIDFKHSPFYVNAELRDWPAHGAPRRAGVSSFGIGGTNVHVIVEEAPEDAGASKSLESFRPYQLLTLSARSQTAAEQMRVNLAAHLQQHPDLSLANTAYTLGVGRRSLTHRMAAVCRSRQDAIAALQDPHRLRSDQVQVEDRPVIFLFPGQGSQFVYMGADLYQTEPVFREYLDYCAEQLQDELGLDLRRVLYPPAPDRQAAEASLEQTWLTQPALFAIEYALAQLWMSWGVTPQAMIGHSLGEYVAACLAGVFDLDTALRLVVQRGRLIWEQPQGAMLAVSLSSQDILPLLTDELSLAASNTPDTCVVSGPTPAIEALAAQLEKQGLVCRRLRTSHAFHSAMMEPALRTFTQILQKIELKAPERPLISNVTGAWMLPEQAVDPHYWTQHLRQTVHFETGIREILQDPNSVLLEVGPGTTLSTFARRHPLTQNNRLILASLHRPNSGQPALERAETQTMLDSLGRLWMAGVTVDWSGYYAHEQLSRVALPGYPFERQRYWIDAPDREALGQGLNRQTKQPLDKWFYLPSWKPSLTPRALQAEDLADQSHPWLVLSDDSELSRLTIARLEQYGQKVITVFKGKRYEQDGKHTFHIRPTAAVDYVTMIQETDNQPISKVIHFWSLSETDESGSDIYEISQENGYYSLLFLGKVLSRQASFPGTTIAVIANHLHDVTGLGESCPEKTTLLGPCLVMPQEAPQLTCRCLDIVLPPPGAGAHGKLVEMLLTEIELAPNDPLVAYRGHHRLLPRFDQVMLDAVAADAKTVRQFRPQGVYLITGGLGNVGLLLSRYLAETVQARLVLLGRSFFPPRADWDAWLQSHPEHDACSRTIRHILELERLGSEVLLVRADVANENEMQAALDQTYQQFGALHGIIYAAGRLRDSSFVSAFTDVGRRESETQFTSKIHGLYVLAKLLGEQALDFCLLMSSNAAVLGGLGFVAYSAANNFMDAFAARQNQSSKTPWLSTNWDALLLNHSPAASSVEEFSITPQESIEAFQRVVCRLSAGRIMIAAGNLQARFDQWVRREGWLESATPQIPAAQHLRPDLATAYTAPASAVESQLTSLWQEVLGFNQVGIHDDFFELGGDSLLAIRLMSMIKERFGKQLPLTALLDKSSIHQLAEALDQSEAASSFSPLVAMQSKGARPPLFCVPGTGGNVLYFNELARCLATYERPFYAFQARGLDGQTPPLTRIEDIAAQNIQALQEVQACGPYYLGGHSFGSWVAFEMARQLHSAGQEVALLAILDTGVPAERDLSAMGGWDDTRWLVTVAEILGHMYNNPLVLDYNELAPLTWTGQLEVLTRSLETFGIVEPGQTTANMSQIRGFVEVYKTQAQIRYHPTPEPRVKIALFRAHEPLAEFLAGMPEAVRNDDTWGWHAYSQGRPRVEYIPGDHLTMMTQPHVQELARRLEAVLL